MASDTDYQVFVLSSEKSPHHANVIRRFEEVKVDVTMVEEIPHNDVRIFKHPSDRHKTYSIMYGHLKMIKAFLDTGKDYGIFCENDIFVHRNMRELLPKIILDFERLELDIMLMGYLLGIPISGFESSPNIQKISMESKSGHDYYIYPNTLWGAQMYMLSKKHAQYLIGKYNEDYADRSEKEHLTPFSSDWTLTKDGKRALIHPMLAIENPHEDYGDEGQNRVHLGVVKLYYDEKTYT